MLDKDTYFLSLEADRYRYDETLNYELDDPFEVE